MGEGRPRPPVPLPRPQSACLGSALRAAPPGHAAASRASVANHWCMVRGAAKANAGERAPASIGRESPGSGGSSARRPAYR